MYVYTHICECVSSVCDHILRGKPARIHQQGLVYSSGVGKWGSSSALPRGELHRIEWPLLMWGKCCV